MLVDLRKRDQFPFLRLDFVVQDHNYQEMPDFVKLGKELGVDQVMFQKISNWGTFSEDEFANRAIYLESHPEFTHFVKIASKTVFKTKFVNPGNLGKWMGPVHKEHKFNLVNAVFHTLRKRIRTF